VHTQVASQLKGSKLERIELKARSLLLGACTSCPLLRFDLEASVIEIQDLKHQIDHYYRYSVLSHLCKMCDSLKGKLFHSIKENTELKQEVTYLTSHLERTVLSEKMIEEDLSHVEEGATKSTYKLGVGFERCENKGGKSAPKFIPRSIYHEEEKTIKSTKTYYPSNPKPSFNLKREVRKEIPKPREEAFVYMFCGCAGHLDEFCFRRKRIEKMHFEYARNSCHDEFLDFLPHSYSRARLAHVLMLCLVSLMDLTIAHMVLVHERTSLCLDVLVIAHVLIVVTISRIGIVFLLESLTPALSPDTWTIHVFSIMVHVPLVQRVRCKRL
jgi:hypothetical protein